LAPVKEKKDPLLAYALWCLSLVGICGVQRMYLGQVGLGLLMLFTFGFCGIAQLLDLFLIPSAVQNSNRLVVVGEQVEGGPSEVQNVVANSSAQSARAASSSSPIKQDDDLELLLRQAERSVQRTEGISEDN
jgi:TM2 domain-containing membrane protein YozV|tara:strand:- start:1455 stop:1850 length:396 start_codon:yes stop_codon:yes gene_type:complete